jgi:hypothetical protein
VWNLPAGRAGAALDPLIARFQSWPNLEQCPEDGGISRAPELALRQVPHCRRIERIDSNTGGLRCAVMLLTALAGPDPMTALDLAPRDRDGRIGPQNPAVIRMTES